MSPSTQPVAFLAGGGLLLESVLYLLDGVLRV